MGRTQERISPVPRSSGNGKHWSTRKEPWTQGCQCWKIKEHFMISKSLLFKHFAVSHHGEASSWSSCFTVMIYKYGLTVLLLKYIFCHCKITISLVCVIFRTYCLSVDLHSFSEACLLLCVLLDQTLFQSLWSFFWEGGEHLAMLRRLVSNFWALVVLWR